MRYLMHKRLKNPAPMEITERRQVGDAEATVNRTAASSVDADRHPARGSDSEL